MFVDLTITVPELFTPYAEPLAELFQVPLFPLYWIDNTHGVHFAYKLVFELNALGLFYFEDLRLDPIREVSRGELAYFLVRLANVFGSSN